MCVQRHIFGTPCRRQKGYGKARQLSANLARTEINAIRETSRACPHIRVIRVVCLFCSDSQLVWIIHNRWRIGTKGLGPRDWGQTK
jgi:hypothetical protein